MRYLFLPIGIGHKSDGKLAQLDLSLFSFAELFVLMTHWERLSCLVLRHEHERLEKRLSPMN